MADQRMTGPPLPDKPFEPVVSSGGLIFNEEGKILILRRKIEKNWVLPKGKQELGETLEENALREVEEETGISNLEIDRHIGLVRYVFHWFLSQLFSFFLYLFTYQWTTITILYQSIRKAISRPVLNQQMMLIIGHYSL